MITTSCSSSTTTAAAAAAMFPRIQRSDILALNDSDV